MSAPDEKEVSLSGHPAQIVPTGSKVRITVDGQEIGLVTAADLEADAKPLKPTDQQPGETRDQHFLRMFRGAFFGPNAMRNHRGRKAKKGKR